MGEVAAAYAGCRERVGGLIRAVGSDAAARVPACPEWSVHDVVAHLAGVVDDALAGRLDGVATDAWTAAQVEARRDVDTLAIIEEWDDKAPQFEAFLDAIGDPGRQAVADAVTHEHDIRGALGLPGEQDSDAVHIGLGFLAGMLVQSALSNGGLRLVVRATDGATYGGVDGGADPDAGDATVAGTAFELIRAIAGRRSESQLRSLDWSGDVDRAISAFTFGPFRPAAQPIAE